jgi:hypothetical protein
MQRTRVIGGAAALLIAAGAAVALHDTRGNTPVARDSVAASSGGDNALALGTSDSAAGAPPDANPEMNKVGVVAPSGPRVVKTATLSLSVNKKTAVADVTDRVARLAEAHSGYVASTQSERGEAASSTITLRVPASAYSAAVAELRGLGKVTNESFGGQDVSGQLVDLDARLRSLRAQEQALNALLGKANTVGETLQVAQASADVRTQIEQLAAQQAQLADQADFATITVRVLGPNAGPNIEPRSEPLLVKSFERAGAGALNVLGGMIIVLGYAIPSAVLAALGFGVWHLVNRRRRGEAGAEPAVA